MSLRTITKNTLVVISISLAAALFSSCSIISFGGSEPPTIDNATSPFGNPEVVAHLSSSDIDESSGLAVSKCQKDVFWTHNDSGGGPFLYAFDSGGKNLGTWRLNGAKNADWEDMATVKAADGQCYLYVGEIGDNEQRRDSHSVFRIREPRITADGGESSKKAPLSIDEFGVLKFRYQDGRHNAETLLVHPATNEIYVISKELGGPSEVFKLDPKFDEQEVQTAIKVGAVSLPAIPTGLVTGGDISPDGKRVALCDYFSGYEIVLPEGAKTFDEIWMQNPIPFDLGPREIGESIAYADTDTIFATTEKPKPPLIRVVRKQK
jgi:hypothetical protein